MNKNRWIGFFAVFLLLFALTAPIFAVSVSASAEKEQSEGEPYEDVRSASENGLQLVKTVRSSGENISVTLEAYATGEGKIVVKPLDIVMVLDVSGSMDEERMNQPWMKLADGSDLSALDPAYSYDADKGVDYYRYGSLSYSWLSSRMKYENGVWKYQDGSSWKPVPASGSSIVMIKKSNAMRIAANRFLALVGENASLYGADHRLGIVTFSGNAASSGLLDVGTQSETLREKITGLQFGGLTRTDLGMEKAEELLNGSASDRNKLVILLTDGAPTGRSSENFSNEVADQAITSAKRMKAQGTRIYTLGVFNSISDNSLLTLSKEFSENVSSDYPDAESMSRRGERVTDKEYFLMIDEIGGLSEAFEGIAEEMIVTEAKADADAALLDTLTPYFTQSGDSLIFSALVASRTGDDSWSDPEPFSDVSVSVSEDKKTVMVTGFDYTAKENLVIRKEDGWHGRKLIFTFAIRPDENAVWQPGTHDYETNADALIRPGDGTEALVAMTESPVVPVTAYTVSFAVEDTLHCSFVGGETEISHIVPEGLPFPERPVPAESDAYFFDRFVEKDAVAEPTKPRPAVTVWPEKVTEDSAYLALFSTRSTDYDPENPSSVLYRVDIFEGDLAGEYKLTDSLYFSGKPGEEVVYAPEERAHLTVSEASVLSGTVFFEPPAEGQTEPEFLVLRVYYDPEAVIVTFEAGENGSFGTGNSSGGKPSVQYDLRYGEPFPVPPEPKAEEGFAFGGWTDANGVAVSSFPETATENAVYRAVWLPVTGESAWTAEMLLPVLIAALTLLALTASSFVRRRRA